MISLFFSFAQQKKTMKRLPDTGQNTSYTGTFGEDNDYNFNIPSFTKNSNGTTTDQVTGLMWQTIDGGEMTIENAAQYCDTLTLGGYSDWRLPNSNELFSILNHDKTNPAIDTTYFTKTTADYWWSAQRQKNDSSKVWVTNAGGGVGNKPTSETISAGGSKRFHVRAVRDVSTPINLPSHFLNRQDGTIKDSITGLMWTSTLSSDTITWEQALSLAENSNFANHSDWRLPNIKELQSINDEMFMSPSLDTNYFKFTGNKQIWSSTTLFNKTTQAWYLDTRFGITTYAEKTPRRLYALLVRTDSVDNNNIDPTVYNQLTISPNPANHSIAINLPNNQSDANLLVRLFNNDGRLVLESTSKIIDVTSLAAGVYFIRITFGSETSTKKVIIQH